MTEETFEARPQDEQDPSVEPGVAPGTEEEPAPVPGGEETAPDAPEAPDEAADATPAEDPIEADEPMGAADDAPEAPEALVPAEDEPGAAEESEPEPEAPAMSEDTPESAEETPAEEAALQVVSEDEAVNTEGVTTGEPVPYEAPAAASAEAAASSEPAMEAAPSETAAAVGVLTAEPEPEPAAEPEPEPAAESAPAAEEPAEEAAWTPFDGPGDWYVVHTYAGYENKVKANLTSRIGSMQMEDKIFDVVIPMEDVMEIKGGKKQVVQKKVFPGYLLVKMFYDNDSWYVVRNTPGVTGFVVSGTGQKPTPLSRKEVEKILAVKEEEKAKKPSFRLEFEEGDVVRIISGPFADFNGTIVEINVDQSKLKVLVNIFDRETPVELGFDQVARV